MSIEAILLNQTQRQALNAIKSDTEDILLDTTTLKTNTQTVLSDTATLKANTTTIINKLNNVYDKKRYGFRIKKSEGDPARRVEYIYDAVGMTPARVDFNTHKIIYGSWANVWFIKQNYPCMVLNSGTEDYKLNPNDYSKKFDGSNSDYANTAYPGNAMAAIPLCWVKRYEDDMYEYFIVCDSQYDDSYKAYAHTNAEGVIVDRVYHAMFKGSIVDGKMRSLAGQNCQNSTNGQQEWDAIKATGERFSMRPWSLQCLIADLLTLISKTEQSQGAFGMGQVTGYVDDASKNYGHLPNSILGQEGNLIQSGQFGGYSDTTHHVKVFHIEDFWGNRWDRMIGINSWLGINYVKMTPEGTGYSLTTVDGYHPLPMEATDDHGWQKDTYMSEYGRVPVTVGAAENTYVCDFTWIQKGQYNAPMVGLAGGSCADGSRCGSRYLALNALASGAFWNLGSSLTLV